MKPKRTFFDGTTYDSPGLWIDQHEVLWVGPLCPDDNLHFAVVDGVDSYGEFIRTLRASELPDGTYTRLDKKPDPPKPKRREWRWKSGNCVRVTCPATSIVFDGCHIREVLPGDPDPDVVLEALAKIKQWCNAPNDRAYARIMDLCNRIEASRETK